MEMSRVAALTLALTCAGAAFAKDAPAPANANHRLAGLTYALSFGAAPSICRETWTFGADDRAEIRSGEEIVSYRYALRPDGRSFYRLSFSDRQSNGAPDCQGNRSTGAGPGPETLILFTNDDGFYVCASTDTMSCAGSAILR